MSENKHLTQEQVKNLEMARLTYQGRMRDWINRRAEELVKFCKMQSSVIVQPNQQELHAQAQKLQQHDMEIKRFADLIASATVLITYSEKIDLLDNLPNVRGQIKLAYETIIDTGKDLQKTTIEEVFAVSIIRDMMQYVPVLYPNANPVEEVAAKKAAQDPANQRQDGPGMLDSGLNIPNAKGVDGLGGSLLVSV
ncbi:hypothetical protein [Ralstonia phage RSF1]|uniref:Uncharacterized protein n=1 Tax=Ralstonia phage RSF1 TaxID=1689679 RepID=A0A0K2QQN2_9CAUD|nr:hypothetical protein AVU11_gp107 [Ralstonia phage RSF1]BAS04899.1 hypothetical protein [Ralstonia phage RSF1]